MPSFDIASTVDLQTLDNAVNVAKRELDNRYDFKGSGAKIELNKKEYIVDLEVASEMQMTQLEDILLTKAMRQGIESNAFDFSKEMEPSGKTIRKKVTIKNGLGKEDAKKVVKLIKDGGFKVQAAIMDDIVRVTGKKIDDLQAVIASLKSAGLDFPLQFQNMKS